MFDFSKVEEVIIEPYRNKFIFNYNILSAFNVLPKEINIYILSIRYNQLFVKLKQVHEDEKLSLMLQVLGIACVNNQDVMRQEIKFMEFILPWVSAGIFDNTDKSDISFKSIYKLLNTYEMINEYNQIDKDCVKVKQLLLPSINTIKLNYLYNAGMNSSTMGDMIAQSFKTKEKYLIHLINILK